MTPATTRENRCSRWRTARVEKAKFDEMKILVIPKLRAGAPVEELRQHRMAEIRAIWDLYAQGVLREFYARADQPGGAVLMIESPSVEAAREALAALPLVQLNVLDLDMYPLAPFTHLQGLFQAAS